MFSDPVGISKSGEAGLISLPGTPKLRWGLSSLVLCGLCSCSVLTVSSMSLNVCYELSGIAVLGSLLFKSYQL